MCRRYPSATTLLLTGVTVLTAGCATAPGGRGWGQAPLPNGERLADAARAAATDARTVLPLAGAFVLWMVGGDDEVVDWAVDHTPVFGSRKKADDASDVIVRETERLDWFVIAAAPSGATPLEWLVGKARGLVVASAAINGTDETTDLLKRWTGRERPDESDRRSFPSGHASRAAAHATFAARSLDVYPVGRRAQAVGDAVFATAAVATAWARVEAGRHHPTDVLAGLALGHFLTAFLYDGFLAPSCGRHRVVVAPNPRAASVSITLQF